MIQFFHNTKFDFIKLRYMAYLISGILVLSGVIGCIQIARGKANIGIDFSGASEVQIKFDKELDPALIRAALDRNDLKDTTIQQLSDAIGEPKVKVLLKIKQTNVKVGELGVFVTRIFAKEFPNDKIISLDKVVEVGPGVSSKYKNQAFWSIFLAMIAITIYIWFRFEFRFGIAAAIATFHDVLVLIGVVYFMNKEFTLLIVTALLTIAGYSLTDTVVVFDRIRENLRLKIRDPLENIINLSVNEVLGRTVMTSVTTLLAATALFFIAGEVVHDFSFVLVVGIIVGTYSSVFVASPILLEWEKSAEKKTNNK